mmetsp:Transcript_65642/g.184837  ORF Transcript_65642/g.184837 Transcript_65642/m.184837 type:complete len:153 (+) Transcript_65642:98-556(+)
MAPAPLTCVLLLLGISGAAATNPEGEAFLAEKAASPGVVKLDSGLMYEVLEEGSGEVHPGANTPCKCNYEGTLIDGTKFDSSYDRGQPATFAPQQVIPGWTEAMQLMVKGDKWKLYIPSELAYGEQGAGGKIPGGAALIFTMKIEDIIGVEQ